jgi:hypothetical protein
VAAGGRKAAEPIGPVELPAPRLVARRATPSELGRSAERLSKLAVANGWSVVPTVAIGPRAANRGRSFSWVLTMALRMWRGSEHAVALWSAEAPAGQGGAVPAGADSTWKIDGCWCWRRGELWRRVSMNPPREGSENTVPSLMERVKGAIESG